SRRARCRRAFAPSSAAPRRARRPRRNRCARDCCPWIRARARPVSASASLRSPGRSSTCWRSSCAARGASSSAARSSTPSGAATWSSAIGRWTSTSRPCAASRRRRAAARAIAELAARTPANSLRPILQAFTRSAIDTDVAFLDGEGHVVLEAGEAHPGVARVSAEAPVAGGGTVRVRKATFGMVQLMSDVAPKVALLALMFAVASAALAMLIGGAVAGPIERLTRAAERVAAGERQAPLPEPRGRDVRALPHALEPMRKELEARHALETFVADVSHELKNPVAAIRASAEVL